MRGHVEADALDDRRLFVAMRVAVNGDEDAVREFLRPKASAPGLPDYGREAEYLAEYGVTPE